MEYKIYIQSTRTFETVTEEVYHAFYNLCTSERKRLQKEGKCFCPRSQVWRCDCDCVICPYSPKESAKTEDIADETDMTPSSDDTDTESQISLIALEELIAHLNELYPDAERIIRLRSNGYSDREIETIIGTPRKTFEYRIEAALKKLGASADNYH